MKLQSAEVELADDQLGGELINIGMLLRSHSRHREIGAANPASSHPKSGVGLRGWAKWR